MTHRNLGDRTIFFPPPEEALQTRLTKPDCSYSAFCNASGFSDNEFQRFQDIVKKTAKEQLDFAERWENQDKTRRQVFLARLAQVRELDYIFQHYVELWPIVVLIKRLLLQSSKSRARIRKGVTPHQGKIPRPINVTGHAMGSCTKEQRNRSMVDVKGQSAKKIPVNDVLCPHLMPVIEIMVRDPQDAARFNRLQKYFVPVRRF